MLDAAKKLRDAGQDITELLGPLRATRQAFLRQEYEDAARQADVISFTCEEMLLSLPGTGLAPVRREIASTAPSFEPPPPVSVMQPLQPDSAVQWRQYFQQKNWPAKRVDTQVRLLSGRPFDPHKFERTRKQTLAAILAIVIVFGVGMPVFGWALSSQSTPGPSSELPPTSPPPPPPPITGFTGFRIVAEGDDTNCWSGAFGNVASSSSINGCGDREVSWSCDGGYDVLSGVVQKQDDWAWTLSLSVVVGGTVRKSAATSADYGVASAADEC